MSLDVYKDICCNPTSYLSPRELFDKMVQHDGAVCFIGMVAEIVGPQSRGSTELAIIILTNRKDSRIQLTLWGQDIERWFHVFNTVNVVHIIGAYSTPRRSDSKGNVPMDVTVKSYTMINVVGRQEIMSTQEPTKKYIPIELKDVLLYNEQYVTIEAFLKLTFVEEPKFHTCIGSIARETFRFEVRCQDKSVIGLQLEEGIKLQLSGIVKCNSMPHYLLIQKYSDIKVLTKEKISMDELAKAVYRPRKRKIDQK